MANSKHLSNRPCQILSIIIRLQSQVKLTNRESEVLELMTYGKTNPEIGVILNISANTVSSYVKQIYLKLGTTDRVTTALKALREVFME